MDVLTPKKLPLIESLLIICCILYPRNCHASWAEETFASLSLDQKISQLFMVPARADSSLPSHDNAVSQNHVIQDRSHMHQDHVVHLIKTYDVGGVIYMGRHTIDEQRALTERFNANATIPLLFGQDFEWGLGMRLLDGKSYPRAEIMAKNHDATYTYNIAYGIGMQCRAIGVHINFAPVVDVNTNPLNPIIGTRSYGATPEIVIEHATAYTQGLLDAGVLPCIKHFPGHGDTSVDSHSALPLIAHDRERLDQIELAPFKALIHNGIPAVMVAHLKVPTLDPNGTPSSLSRAIVTDLLRNHYGFRGLIITDGLDMRALDAEGDSAHNALAAFKAGNDILLSVSDTAGAHDLIKKSVLENPLLMAELDAHVLRILKAKEWILQTPSPSPV